MQPIARMLVVRAEVKSPSSRQNGPPMGVPIQAFVNLALDEWDLANIVEGLRSSRSTPRFSNRTQSLCQSLMAVLGGENTSSVSSLTGHGLQSVALLCDRCYVPILETHVETITNR